MQKLENTKLFIVLLFVLSLTTLLYNFQNPLFRMKLQLILKGYKAEPQATNLESKGRLLSIYKLMKAPRPTPILPTVAPQEYLEPTSLPTPVPLRNLASALIPRLPTQEPTSVPVPSVLSPSPTRAIPTPKPTAGLTQIAWKSIFRGVQAAENSQTGSVTVKVDKDTEYVKRMFTLKDGRQIEVIVPVFKN